MAETETTVRPGAVRGAWRRLGAARAGLAVYAFGWLAATLLGSLPAATVLEQLARSLPGGSGDLAQPGGLLAFEALIAGMRSLGWSASVALGIALAWGVAAEPFLRGALLCRLAAGCGAECAPRRGTLARGARHFLRMLALQVLLWASLVGAAVALLLGAGSAAVLALPPLWLLLSVLCDVAATTLVGAPTVRAGLRAWTTALRRRPAALLGGGLALRLAAHVPLALLGVLVAAGPDGSPLRPLLLLALPLGTLVVRAGWWALATELTRRAAGANFRGIPAGRA
ncbi:MAG: hypothetical protein JXB32_17275 [Deltaproteobacteria bacterium]|nr:hypothetical protein [Deltaproteobacteria bacterium]